MTHGVTAKPNLQNAMRQNTLKSNQVAGNPVGTVQRISKNAPKMSFSFEAQPQKSGYNPSKDMMMKSSMSNQPIPRVMQDQTPIGQPPLNQECGAMSMGIGRDTSKWGLHQDIKLNDTTEVNSVLKNIQNISKAGFKFMSKAADTTAVGAAASAGASYSVTSSGAVSVRNNHFATLGFRM